MKKLLTVLLVIGVATPTAWGLYSSTESAPGFGLGPFFPATDYRERVGRDWPLMRELQQVNDWGVGWKNRLRAYLGRENTAAQVAGFKSCYPAIGAGLVAQNTTLRPDGPGDVVGEIVNTAAGTIPSAEISVRLYDSAGKLVGQTRTKVSDLRFGVPRTFRAMVSRLPLDRVRAVEVSAVVSAVVSAGVSAEVSGRVLRMPAPDAFTLATHTLETQGLPAQGCGHAPPRSHWSPATSSSR